MLTPVEEQKIKEKIESKLGINILSLFPISSDYGLKREHPKRVYLVKTANVENYVLYVGRFLTDADFVSKHEKFRSFFPKEILYFKIKFGYAWEVILYEHLKGAKISDIFADGSTTSEAKDKILSKVYNYFERKRKYLGKAVPKSQFSTELRQLVDLYSDTFDISSQTCNLLKAKMDKLVNELPRNMLFKRFVNFDFVPENLIINQKGELKLIDLEYGSESVLHLVEPTRFAYFLAFEEYTRLTETNFNTSPFFIEYTILSLFFVNSAAHHALDSILSKYGISKHSYPKIVLLFWMCKALLRNKLNMDTPSASEIYTQENVLLSLSSENILASMFFHSEKESYLAPMDIKGLINKVNELNNELASIKNSKFYVLWRKYCSIREAIKKKVIL